MHTLTAPALVIPGALSAVQHIKRMRGGTQSHLLRASDGKYYVTKFQNNPQHARVLANEFLATRLGLALSLPLAEIHPIAVSDWLIENTTDLRIEANGIVTPCSSGLQVGSQYVADPLEDHVYDYLPESLFSRTINPDDFARVLVFDKWTGNCDGRQAVFVKKARQPDFEIRFVDQGYCFNAGKWSFPDLALHGVYYQNHVYARVTGWDSFEPTLSRLEQFDASVLWECASAIPHEWGADSDAVIRLADTLYERRSLVRDLILKFRNSSRNPFPNWNHATGGAKP